MKKLTVLLASAILVTGSPAFAGEVTGNGKTAQGAAHASSECAYSGLNDSPWDLMGSSISSASTGRRAKVCRPSCADAERAGKVRFRTHRRLKQSGGPGV